MSRVQNFFAQLNRPEYWIKLRAWFTWHNRRALAAEYGTPEFYHHSRCLCLIGATLQRDEENFRKLDNFYGRRL